MWRPVPANSPANPIADLLALAKSKPNGLNFGSPGARTRSHLASAKLPAAGGIKAFHPAGRDPVLKQRSEELGL